MTFTQQHDPATTSDERFMTVAEAAARVGMHHRAIRRAIARGELQAAKVCSRIRIAPADFEAWIAGSRVAPREAPEPTAHPSNGLRRLLDGAPDAA